MYIGVVIRIGVHEEMTTPILAWMITLKMLVTMVLKVSMPDMLLPAANTELIVRGFSTPLSDADLLLSLCIGTEGLHGDDKALHAR